jgi:hypothetical protein
MIPSPLVFSRLRYFTRCLREKLSCQGNKTEDDKWDMRPHRNRIVHVNQERLSLFARLYDEPGTPAEQARLPVIHSEEIARVLEKIAGQKRRLGELPGVHAIPEMWNETRAQIAGIIKRETRHASSSMEWIVSGPHFFVATPFNKTPNEGCSTNLDYSDIDLTTISDDYLPRTNYVPACAPAEYRRRTPSFDGNPATDYYRHVHREMVSPTGERTLVAAIMPPGCGHISTVVSICFSDHRRLLYFSGLASSLVYDFAIKSGGAGHVNVNHISVLPFPERHGLASLVCDRTLRLNCLSRHYASLWESVSGTPWHRGCALRNERERRQALVELDALAALALDLTEDELITIYRVQFPVLRQYEREDLYDQTGRLVPTGVLVQANRHNIDIRQPLNVSSFTGLAELVGEVETPGHGVTGGIVWEDPKMEPRMKRVYPPPFTKCDRETDMRLAYQVFQERLRRQENAP